MKKGFERFGVAETLAWFEQRGVPLKVESDGRVFPVSDQSRSVVQCLMQEAQRLGIETRTGQNVKKY